MTAPIERLRAVLAAATPGTRLERIAAARVRGAETWGDGKTLVKDDDLAALLAVADAARARAQCLEHRGDCHVCDEEMRTADAVAAALAALDGPAEEGA